jgi:hypothetical protein
MAFSRPRLDLLADSSLDGCLRGCGLRVGKFVPATRFADLELTLASAARQGLPSEYRLLGVLAAWLAVHHCRVNVPRLGRLIRQSEPSVLESAWWATVGGWLGAHDLRWKALLHLYSGPRLGLEGDDEITDLMIQRHGEDRRFEAGPLRVHSKLLRSRLQDVDTPEQLVRRHATYRARVIHGTNHRADIWAELDRDADRPVAEVARAVGCAYESARSIVGDWRLAQAAR